MIMMQSYYNLYELWSSYRKSTQGPHTLNLKMRTRGKMPPATKKSKRRRDMAKEIKRGSEPSHLLCTITGLMFRDPVCVFPGGQTYDRPAISAWMSKGGTDPLTKTEIVSIATNWALRNYQGTYNYLTKFVHGIHCFSRANSH